MRTRFGRERLPGSRTLFAPRLRLPIFLAFVLSSATFLAEAQTATPAPSSQILEGQQPNSSGVEAASPAEQGMSPERQKMMDDALTEPRKIAAAIIAADFPPPKMVVQVGAFQGEFLEVFLDKFPGARGQWTEAITSEHNFQATRQRFARFGDRVDFKWGCARRDISRGCDLPANTDVILIEWLSIQQDLDGMARIYQAAANRLPSNGWIVNVDHVSFSGTGWDPLVHSAVQGFRRPEIEGPPVHYPQFKVPTAEEQLAAMRTAGFDAQLVWQSFNTVLLMGRKK